MDGDDWKSQKRFLEVFFLFSNSFFGVKVEDYNLKFFSAENKSWVNVWKTLRDFLYFTL